MATQYKKYAVTVLFYLYDLSGLRWIYEKIRTPHPEIKMRPPSTFLIWLVGSYVALFGLTSGLYNQEKEALEGRLDFLLANSTSETLQYLVDNLSIYQRTPLPIKPQFISLRSADDFINGITSPLLSLVDISTDDGIKNKVGRIIVLKKNRLSGITLEDFKLENLDLSGADFSASIIDNVSFEGSDIGGANFKNAHLSNVSFKDVIFAKSVDFSNAVLDNVYITYRNDYYDRLGGPRWRTILDNALILNSTIDLNEFKRGEDGFSPPISSALVNTNIFSDNPAMAVGMLCISREQFLNLNKRGNSTYSPHCRNFEIQFDFDTSEINANSTNTLDLAIDVITSFGEMRCKITVEGHTTSTGPRDFSLRLGNRKTAAVKNYLVSRGIPAVKLNTVSYGQERPIHTLDYLNNAVVINIQQCLQEQRDEAENLEMENERRRRKVGSEEMCRLIEKNNREAEKNNRVAEKYNRESKKYNSEVEKYNRETEDSKETNREIKIMRPLMPIQLLTRGRYC
ncbi:MAG: OmpA family protein [Kordiimonadaceae bacterium]|nr:OmpA family protein [Kordiimonadaceae bacterium]